MSADNHPVYIHRIFLRVAAQIGNHIVHIFLIPGKHDFRSQPVFHIHHMDFQLFIYPFTEQIISFRNPCHKTSAVYIDKNRRSCFGGMVKNPGPAISYRHKPFFSCRRNTGIRESFPVILPHTFYEFQQFFFLHLTFLSFIQTCKNYMTGCLCQSM